ncbi:MAG: universal stress protein [Rubrivivax sp.]|nr:universal stress protein [Rubrivivax sp.]
MFKNILVPVDAGDLSERAMQASVALACQLGAAITGFVAEPLQPLHVDMRSPSERDAEAREHAAMTRAHADTVLKRFAAAAHEAGVPFTGFHDQVPRIDEAIIRVAEQRGCDLIVMVTHGRGAFGEFLFGSHTKAVLASSKLPLLVLH